MLRGARGHDDADAAADVDAADAAADDEEDDESNEIMAKMMRCRVLSESQHDVTLAQDASVMRRDPDPEL
eukprot:4271560-Pyramimonas_sp.AAC.1